MKIEMKELIGMAISNIGFLRRKNGKINKIKLIDIIINLYKVNVK